VPLIETAAPRAREGYACRRLGARNSAHAYAILVYAGLLVGIN
ncbi:uncharacterized protein METZ01_LOCUS178530, partial [marine metagenome]